MKKNNFNKFNTKELKDKLLNLQEAYLKYRVNRATGKETTLLKNNNFRKDISRILNILRARSIKKTKKELKNENISR
ncbi:MAG: 50S ribosomal protein L29 [Bacilli bacterium]|nr:50S ribosomal protein L29 [Bacilli bacterium]